MPYFPHIHDTVYLIICQGELTLHPFMIQSSNGGDQEDRNACDISKKSGGLYN